MLEDCLTIRRKLLPPDHPDIAIALRRLSELKARQGLKAEAADALAASDAIRRRSQTRCGEPDCDRKTREDGTPLTMCVACKRTHYCSVACQTADWRREEGHKGECKALAAGVAAEVAAATKG